MSRNIKVKNDSIKKGDMKTTAMVWMSLSPQNSHIGILTSNITVLEVGAFGRWLGYKGGTLMNGISVLIKDIPQSSCLENTPRSLKPRKRPPPNHSWASSL